ncbi:MAG: hypothetical protein R2860_12785 [Desulfobacterales bacterium]
MSAFNGCFRLLVFHDKHIKALADKGCAECHPAEKEKFVFKFKRTKEAGYETEKNYIMTTASAAIRRKRPGINAGPLASDCRLCHSRASEYQSNALPFGMDKSPHFRHEILNPSRCLSPGHRTQKKLAMR